MAKTKENKTNPDTNRTLKLTYWQANMLNRALLRNHLTDSYSMEHQSKIEELNERLLDIMEYFQPVQSSTTKPG